jgi:SWI/SNF-related matrix-associated actin-dependent regulator 1 of chromatin subfamily A
MADTVLKPHQEEGVAQIQTFGGRALLADDMSLGKTIQSYTWAKRHLKRWPMVVVVPASLRINWQREGKRHCNLDCRILEGRKPKKLTKGRHCYVLSYDVLKYWVPALKRASPGLVVFDEAHRLANRKSKWTQAAKELCEGVPHVIAATGTPTSNRPAELFPILNIIKPKVFNSFFAYAKKYCQMKRVPWGGWDFSGAKNLKTLHKVLRKHCMVRRLTDVLGPLPEKRQEVVLIDLPKQDTVTYKKAEADYRRWLKRIAWHKMTKAEKQESMHRQGYLKRLAAKMKMEAVREWVRKFLDGELNRTDKLLLFGEQKALVKYFHEEFPKSVMVNGTITGAKRQKAFDSFNADPRVELFCGNTRAAGMGWSCVSSSSVAFFELDWNPAMHTQAERRVWGLHRGRKGKRVRIYYLVARGTIEEKILKVIQRKQKNSDTITDGRQVEKFNAFDLVAASYLGGN